MRRESDRSTVVEDAEADNLWEGGGREEGSASTESSRDDGEDRWE
jgi:hypothetical protein